VKNGIGIGRLVCSFYITQHYFMSRRAVTEPSNQPVGTSPHRELISHGDMREVCNTPHHALDAVGFEACWKLE